MKEVRDRGFSVAQLKELLLSRQTAEELYKEQREEPFFSQLVEFMCRFVRLSTKEFLGSTFPDNLSDSE